MAGVKTEIMKEYREVNGKVERDEDGYIYWMGSRVMQCPDCGVAPTNVDDCGHFGDPKCPYFGIGE